jgi:hypothetical protein
VTKNLSLLKNVVGFENEDKLGNAVIIMDKENPFLADMLEEFLHRSVNSGFLKCPKITQLLRFILMEMT